MTTAVMVSDKPILPRQVWEDTRGKHKGRRVQIVSFNGITVFAKYLKGTGRSWDGSTAGKVIAMGANAFRQNYEPVHVSGGGSVHDAPLPPAAWRGPLRREEELIDVHAGTMNGTHDAEPAEIAPTTLLKVCSHCGLAKEHSEFNRAAATPDGLHRWCKECRKQAYHEAQQSDRGRSISDAMKRPEVRANIVAGNLKAFERLTVEQKHEIIALRSQGTSYHEIQRAYGLNGAVYAMVAREHETGSPLAPETETTKVNAAEYTPVKIKTVEKAESPSAPEVDKREAKRFSVTYTVLRPVEVTEEIEASSLWDAADKFGLREGVVEVTKVERL